MPRFNASDFRRRMAGRRVVFVGDSIARGAFTSMFAMVAHGADLSRVKEVEEGKGGEDWETRGNEGGHWDKIGEKCGEIGEK